MTDHRLCGVLLAGGLARRLGGGDKCLLKLGNKTLLDFAIDRGQQQVDQLVLNANGDPTRFAAFALPVVADTLPGHLGPLAGVLSGMRWAEQHTTATHVVSFASDTPFFPVDLAIRLQQTGDSDNTDIVLASSSGRVHPVFGCWPIELADELEQAITGRDIRKVLDWTAGYRVGIAEFDAREDNNGLDPFFNINTAEDLAAAENVIASWKANDLR